MAERASGLTAVQTQIGRSRAAIGATLDALQERLEPVQLARQTAGAVAADFGSAALRVVRKNPLPTALLGLGALWLMYWKRRR